ncbi:MAG: hypothetical protein IIU03_05200, partial [Bacteroidales bacterium]|nr:hypothetical protein [Bacteroidales bacterium]
MRKEIIILSALIISALNGFAQNSRTLMDSGWEFTKDGKTIAVDLPHDWDIYTGPFSGKGATGTGGGWFEG